MRGEQPVTAELIVRHGSVQRGGSTRIGVLFDIEPGWHIYSKDPGDAGLPTTIAWSGPSGVSFGPIEWPTPQQFLDPGEIRTSGYTGAVVLQSTLSLAPQPSAEPSLPIKASVEWLACKELCLPGSARLEVTLPVSPQSPVLSTHAELFDQVKE